MKDIENLSVAELARMISPDSAAASELKKRGVLKTKNTVGELGEFYAINFFKNTSGLPKLLAVDPGVKNVDAMSRKGERYSIKTVSSFKGTTSAFWSPDSIDNDEQVFEYLLVVILNSAWQLEMILQLNWTEFQFYKKKNKRMNAYTISVTKKLISSVKVVYQSPKD